MIKHQSSEHCGIRHVIVCSTDHRIKYKFRQAGAAFTEIHHTFHFKESLQSAPQPLPGSLLFAPFSQTLSQNLMLCIGCGNRNSRIWASRIWANDSEGSWGATFLKKAQCFPIAMGPYPTSTCLFIHKVKDHEKIQAPQGQRWPLAHLCITTTPAI